MNLLARHWVSYRDFYDCGYILTQGGGIKLLRLLVKNKNYRSILNRGGVKDTRLEAKAKDKKKSEAKAKDSLSEHRPSRGQGKECSRPRPRTEDTAASVLQKKGLQKRFSSNLQFIGGARIFDWGGSQIQTTNHMQ